MFFILAPSPSEGIEVNQETIENMVSNQETIEDVVSNQETTETFQETAKEDLSTQGTILCNQGRCEKIYLENWVRGGGGGKAIRKG